MIGEQGRPVDRLWGGRGPLPLTRALRQAVLWTTSKEYAPAPDLFVGRMLGIPWELLPQEMGCGSGVTCWRRLRDWQAAGVWDRLHRTLLDRLGRADRIDWSRASLDSRLVPAKRGAK